MSGLRELHLYAGSGGGILGSVLLGHRIIGAVEINEYCCRVLEQRQRDGILERFPIFQTDIRDFIRNGYAELYKGRCDLISGGFPCQPFSVAGKQLGADDPRNMWPATADCIRIIRPKYAFLENVPGLVTSGYFGTILGDLAESGYDCRWRILSAAELGAPHNRDRLWILADRNRIDVNRYEFLNGERSKKIKTKSECRIPDGELRWVTDGQGNRRVRRIPNSGILRMVDDVPADMDRLKAIGNGQVPAVVAAAWRYLVG